MISTILERKENSEENNQWLLFWATKSFFHPPFYEIFFLGDRFPLKLTFFPLIFKVLEKVSLSSLRVGEMDWIYSPAINDIERGNKKKLSLFFVKVTRTTRGTSTTRTSSRLSWADKPSEPTNRSDQRTVTNKSTNQINGSI